MLAFRSSWLSSCRCTLRRLCRQDLPPRFHYPGVQAPSGDADLHLHRGGHPRVLAKLSRNVLFKTSPAKASMASCSTLARASFHVMQVMRTPLQILFLILVTDLPPSIALGVEPGLPRGRGGFRSFRSPRA